MRILESHNIEYEVITYDWDEEHLDAVHATQKAGLELSQVFKTIVMEDSNSVITSYSIHYTKLYEQGPSPVPPKTVGPQSLEPDEANFEH